MKWMSNTRALRHHTALSTVFLIWLTLSAPWLILGRTVPFDSKDAFFPNLYFASQSIKNGDSPFWNPHVYGGYPMVSDPQSMIFSPLAMGLMLIPDQPSMRWFDGIEFLHLLIGGLGMFWLTTAFGSSHMAAIFAATIFMFGGVAGGRLQHVPMILAYSYFPFALLCLHRALDSMRFRWGVAFGIVGGIMAAHQNQVAYLLALFLIAYTGIRIFESDSIPRYLWSRCAVLGAAVLTGALTLAIPLAATLQFLPLTNRPRILLEDALARSIHPTAFLTLWTDFFSHLDSERYWGADDITTTYFYIGVIPLVLILRHFILTAPSSESHYRFFAGIGLFAILYAVGHFTPLYTVAYHLIPGVNFYRRPSDAAFVLNVVLALLTAHAIDKIAAESNASHSPKVRLVPAVVTAFASLSLLIWALYHARQADAINPSLLSSILRGCALLTISIILARAIARASRRTSQVWLFLALLVLVMDLGTFGLGTRLNAWRQDAFPLLAPQAASADTAIRRLATTDTDLFRSEIIYAGESWPNLPMMYGIQSTQGYNPLRYRLYEATFGAQETGTSTRPFTSLFPDYESPLMDMMGVRFLVSSRTLGVLSPDEAATSRLALELESPDITIWRNPDAFPRVTMATSVYVAPNLESDAFDGPMPPVDYRSTVVIGHLPPDPSAEFVPRSQIALGGTGTATASIRSYRNTEIVVDLEADRDAVLVLYDVFYPYWSVYVDGEPRELYRANVLFRGVFVHAGDKQAIFRFEPFSWNALIGLLTR
jgi:hypothetical protein